MKKLSLIFAAFGLVFSLGYVTGAGAAPNQHVFELRTYVAAPGKFEDLKARFRNHTLKIFEKHGMKNVVYGVPAEGPGASNTLIYLLQHDSRDAAKASWDKFRTDADWMKARAASEANGKLTDKVESVFLEPTDFSPMK